MKLEVEFWTLISVCIGMFGASGGLVWALLRNMLEQLKKRVDERFEELGAAQQKSSSELARRIEISESLREHVAGLEATITQRPSHDDISKVYSRVNDLSDQVGKMTGEMSATRRAVEMMQDFLLNRGGRS